MTPPANIVACAGQVVVTNFSGTPGATFSWTNSNTAIGLGASGSGNISFNAANVGSQEVATITVTPMLGACTGTAVTYTITVNPGPTMNPVADEIVCAGDNVSVVFSSPSGNPTYSWTNSNTAIGLPASGVGNINFNGANVPATPDGRHHRHAHTWRLYRHTGNVYHHRVAGAHNGPAGQCRSLRRLYDQYCFCLSLPGAVFEWTNSNPNVGLPANGTGNISFVTDNPAMQEVATITVTPVIGGCQGPSRTFTITVRIWCRL